MKQPPKKTVQAIIALIVAFALGGAAGGLIEHQRAKNDSNKKSSSPTTTKSGAKAGTAKWFPNPTTAACPELVKWKTTATASYVAVLKKSAWSSTQSVLETQSAAATAALKALLPHANKTGHKGLNVLLTREKNNLAAVKAAKSQADYLKALKTLTKPAATKGTKVMNAAEAVCAKTS